MTEIVLKIGEDVYLSVLFNKNKKIFLRTPSVDRYFEKNMTFFSFLQITRKLFNFLA